MTESLVYVYAILARPVTIHVSGVDGAAVRCLQEGDLVAAISEVPTSEFDEEPLNANIADMAWLGPRAVAHQEVNARLFDASEAMVPLAFGTVFRDEQRVRGLLREQRDRLTRQLERVAGSAEWVLALHLLREPNPEDVAAGSPAVQKLRREVAQASPGRAHLLRQRLQALQRDESRRLQAEAGDRLLRALQGVTVQAYREPLPADAVEKPLLRASLLVRRDRESEFVEEVERLKQQWPERTYRLQLTGPWAPYRFGGLPVDG